ncbi:hypothetical protein HANVADRAFT_20400 [Hanseniaspora valbyensis NRRL Y-1626]|uniref:Glutaredoxin domain-containing protein n=1 Tax=Hanseniaspora valbyensis NRRL Y-1626 TaxID=766949 RepID=A0A1B7TKF0_9ASCO|nr:hypothetical protein HANVADRAFT_20400 [Hanseniaspora valbyensis NRRL Y-1626]
MAITLEAARKEVTQILKNHKFVQLSASWCPDCVYTKNIFQKHGVYDKFYFFEIGNYNRGTKDFDNYYLAFQEAAKKKNLPLIFADGKFIGTEHTIHDWENKGTLEKEFKNLGLL